MCCLDIPVTEKIAHFTSSNILQAIKHVVKIFSSKNYSRTGTVKEVLLSQSEDMN